MGTTKENREQFYRSIRQVENNAVLLKEDENGRMEPLYVSGEFAKMMECSVEEATRRMSGVGFYKSTHPEDRPLVRSMLKHHIAYDGSRSLIIQKLTAKHNRIWCNVHYAFIDDYDGHYVYCTYTDVTRFKMHEERVRSLYASTGNAYYQDSEHTLANFRVNLSRDSFEEVKGRDIYDCDSLTMSFSAAIRERSAYLPIEAERTAFLASFDRDAMIEGYRQGRTRISQIVFSIRGDGRACFVEQAAQITGHPLTGDVMAFVTEIECNRQKVDQTLTGKILEKQFDMVAYLSNGAYGVTIGDAANIKHGSIFPATRHGDYANYITQQVRPVLSGTDEEKEQMLAALTLDVIKREVRKKEPYEVSIVIEMDQTIYYKRFDFYMIDPAADFYILLKSDTTEIQRKQIELNDQLSIALKAANDANVAKTAFLSSMSHEIRTPMNAIIGLDNIALSEEGLPDSTRDHLEKIGGSARHLLSLINDILDMSRIESGRMTIRNEEFSFAGMLEQINTMMESQCRDKGLTYRCHLVGAIGEYYIGDDMRLKQVIINILGNAVKFTPEGGEVSFTVEKVSEFEGQTAFKFAMKDTGIGMDAAYLPKIFEAFSQEDASRTNKYGSTGLGMAITKNIIDLMNGDIAVESEKGKGTTFTVSVSLKNSATHKNEEKRVHPSDLHVLVIDDDPIDLQHAMIVLGESGISADVCRSGKEALDMIRVKAARKEEYNLIFVDWKMPEEDGVAVTRRIRKVVDPESAVIVLTAYNWEEIEEEAKAAGVDSFLPKPLFAGNVMSSYDKIITERGRRNEEEKLADLTGKNILIAEDMAINAQIMQRMLKMKGMDSKVAENGQKAVDMFSESAPGTFDAILMDVRMPVLDGLAATEAIRRLEHPEAKRIPIIAMTANAFDEDVQKSIQAGMNAHLSKPVEPERLYRTLAEMIED